MSSLGSTCPFSSHQAPSRNTALPSRDSCTTTFSVVPDQRSPNIRQIFFSICGKKQQAGQQTLSTVLYTVRVCAALRFVISCISIGSSLRRSLSQISCEAQQTRCPTKEGITALQETGRREGFERRQCRLESGIANDIMTRPSASCKPTQGTATPHKCLTPRIR